MESKLTELKELTKVLSMRDRELHLFKHFIDILPIGVCILDSNSKLYYFNRKATEILGCGVEVSNEVSTHKVYIKDTIQEYPCEKYPIYVSLIDGTPSCANNMEVEPPSGNKYTISMRATPIFDTNGNVEYSLATFYIINEEK